MVGPVLETMGERDAKCKGGGGFGRYCICADRQGDEEDPVMSICLRHVGIYAGNTLTVDFKTRP
eukprot:UN06198